MATKSVKGRFMKLKFGSIIPKSILQKIFFRGIKENSLVLLTEKDEKELYQIGNIACTILVLLIIGLRYLLSMSILISVVLALTAAIAFLFVFGDNVASKVTRRYRDIDEKAFLIINSLAINMTTTQSFPHALELLNTSDMSGKYYQKFFREILYNLNLGGDEQETLQKQKSFFTNKNYQHAFLNIKRKETFIDTDPDFLLNIRKIIAIIEDNISIFIAASCLLPLVLSLVLSLILPANSALIFVFPLFYALFGTFILRYIQNKGVGE